jgi:hypothetical protein
MTYFLDVNVNYYKNLGSVNNINMYYRAANEELVQNFLPTYSQSVTVNQPLDAPNAEFPTIEDAIAYYAPTAGAWLLNEVNTRGTDVYVLRDTLCYVGKGANDLIKEYMLTIPPFSAGSPASLSLSLVGTGATGTQLSSAKPAQAIATVSTSATATIAGAATSTVVMKVCATNSATEGDWTTVGTSETTQSYSLAIALQGVTGGKSQLVSPVLPAGWYVKLSNSGSGTHSESVISSYKTIF